jgi:hypothetical protein
MNQNTLLILAVLGGGAVGTGGSFISGGPPANYVATEVALQVHADMIAEAETAHRDLVLEIREVYLELKIDSIKSELTFMDRVLDRTPVEEREYQLKTAMLTDMQLKLQELQR